VTRLGAEPGREAEVRVAELVPRPQPEGCRTFRRASIGSVVLAGPSTSSGGDASIATCTCAPFPEPVTLFATPTLTSKVSPGCHHERHVRREHEVAPHQDFASAAPTASGLTATAITRSVPLKYSGTVKL